MKAEDLYDEIRRKLSTVPDVQGGIKRVFVDVTATEPGESGGIFDLSWNLFVTPAETGVNGHGIVGQDSWRGSVVAADADELAKSRVEVARLRAAALEEDDRSHEGMLALEDGARQCVAQVKEVEVELARSRGETADVENKLEDAVRELNNFKEMLKNTARERLPNTRESITRKFKIARPGHRNGDLRMYVTVGLYPDGRPGEIFIRSDRVGSFASGALDAVAMVLSMAWQYGVPFEPTVAKLRGMRFEPQGATGDSKYGIVKSPLDYVAKWLLDRFVSQDTPS
jgi:hypothetical protein